MSDLSILVWNCDGLNTPHKRTSVLTFMHRRKIDLALLQETHLLSRDSSRMANRFYHTIASSSAESKSKGVAIVCKHNLKMKVLNVWADTAGRIAVAKVELYGRRIAIISAYAPNKFDKIFYDTLTQKMLELSEYSLIVGADMNAVWHTDDRSSLTASKDQQLATAALQSWVKSLGLIDVWRSFNPKVKDYSFFSARHKSFSRIDFLFTSPQLFQKINDASLLPIALSDHKGVLCSATVGCLSKRAARWRFNTTLLKNEDYKSQLLSQLKDFLDFNLGSVDDPRILWNAVKGFIRSNAICFASNLRKARTAKLQALEADLARIDAVLQSNYSQQIESQREVVKKEINNILKQESEFLIHRTRQRYYFQGSRPSHLLASKIRTNEHFADIPSIRSTTGQIVTDPKQVNETFRTFYSNLYQSEIQLDRDKCQNFLSQLDLPQLPVTDSMQLDAPISLEELKAAALDMQRNKSPGFDGIPPEVYVEFCYFLT